MAAPAAARFVELRLVVRAPTGVELDVAVGLDPGVSVGDLARALARHAGEEVKRPTLIHGDGRPIDPDAPVGTTGLRHGELVMIESIRWHATGTLTSTKPSEFELVVIGGPSSGLRADLVNGDSFLGRGDDCTVALADASASRRHARVRVVDGELRLADAGSANGTFLADRPLRRGEEVALQPGETIRIGRSLVSVRRRATSGESLTTRDDGSIPFNRPPRVTQPYEPLKITLRAPPGEPQRQRLPLVASLAPALIGVVMFLITRQPTVLVFTALSPVMAISSYLSERKNGRRAFVKNAVTFRRNVREAAAHVDEARAGEAAARREAAPDAAELTTRVTEQSRRLWERRPGDDDFLMLRVGLADQASQVGVQLDDGGHPALRAEAEKATNQRRTLPSLPLVVPLTKAGVLGLSGSSRAVRRLARWLVLQVAVLHSPRNVAIVAALEHDGVSEWDWLKWLPHASPAACPLETAPVVTGTRAAAALIRSLNDLLAGRIEAARSGDAAPTTPYVVAVLDAQVLPDRAELSRLLTDGPRHQIGVIWLGSTTRELPGECVAIVELDPRVARLTLTDTRANSTDADADGVEVDLSCTVARGLAPLRDVTAGTRGGVPPQASLLDLLEVPPTAEAVAGGWERPAMGLDAPIGAGTEGPVTLDLRTDGPHGLIAGTTGAGKSELLQTLVAALAVRHRPSRLTFLLIDYKGGAAFKDCVALPHTVGFITDLDGHLTQRALISLNAELRRRESALRDTGVKDLPELETRAPERAFPNLLIVVDEFATLAKEVPDFVDGIVDVAQRGRSLGVHLILATQRPGGVVSENIRANTNLRIALRTNDAAASSDVIGVADAARIARTLPGRAFLRTGHSQLTEVQTAYVGGVSGATANATTITVRKLQLTANEGTRTSLISSSARPPEGPSDLKRIVEAVRLAHERSGAPHPRTPWLPVLPEEIAVGELIATPTDPGAQAVVGLADEPDLQRQRILVHDFEAEGNLLVYGTSGAGKTTFLRSLAISLVRDASPEEVQVYGLDFAARGLAGLEVLPHCGSIISGNDRERVGRLFTTLRRTMAAREEAFADRGVFTLGEYRAAAGLTVQPRIFVLLDGYSGFSDAFERIDLGAMVDALPRLVADGRPLGVHFVITADRRGAVPSALAGIIPTKLVLRMADEDEYATLGLDARRVRGAVLPPGRGFVAPALEVQTALPGDDASGEGQTRALAEVAAALRARDPGLKAPPIQLLPMRFPPSDLPRPRPMLVPFGLSDDDLEPLAVDLRAGSFLVTGPYRSGRSTTLATIAGGLREADANLPLHLLAPRRSPLADLPLWTSVSLGVEDCDTMASRLTEELVINGSDAPMVVVVDDGDELADTLGSGALEVILRRGRDGSARILAASEAQAAMRAYGGWLREIRKDEHGLLLVPNVDVDGDILGVRLPRRSNVVDPPGRGFLVNRGVARLVQVAAVIAET